MAERNTKRCELGRVQKELARWRSEHGGRGRSIPEALWSAAATAASTAGVEATARALDVDRVRLSRRMTGCASGSVAGRKTSRASSARFVELDAERVFSRGQMLVRLTNRAGEQLEIALEGGASDVASVAQAFWSRAR